MRLPLPRPTPQMAPHQMHPSAMGHFLPSPRLVFLPRTLMPVILVVALIMNTEPRRAGSPFYRKAAAAESGKDSLDQGRKF